jgi:serine/threonine protein kinase/tetratricopeptide (TPR) repeat protein
VSEALEREVAVFNAARRLPAEERLRYLNAACGGDPALRQRVEELLQASDEAGGFLQEPAPGAERPAGSAPPDAEKRVMRPAERPGNRIGRYKLLQQIGEGGCGIVYMAEQDEPVRRKVALKVIKLGMDTRQVIARFEAERQALALMDHANIARVFDAGATETGRPYFVMELVRGLKITDYCDQNDLPTRARLDLFIQVCQAIQHAHQKGIIHRDIKPSNILVTVNDGVAVPKVIDFGIAKATLGRLTDATLFTAFEQFIGTPAYMSPEQAVMTSLDVDTRSDAYSLGVLLYELLTGRTPFDGKELLAAGLEEMRRTIREQEPLRPSTRLSAMLKEELTTTAKRRQTEPLKLIHLVRGDLDWIVMKCLEKDRARRYETANGLARDIQRFLNCEPVGARPPSRLYEFQKTLRRHKFGFGAAGAVTGALLAGLLVSTSLLMKERAARQTAVAAERKAQTESSKRQQVAQLWNETLQSVGPSVALGRNTTMLREILDKTADRLGKLTNQPEVEAEFRTTIGNVYQELAVPDKAEAMYRRVLELNRSLWGEQHTNVADSLVNLANALRSQNKFVEAEATLRQALQMQEKLVGAENQQVANTLFYLAYVLYWQKKLDDAETLYRKSLAMSRKFAGNESPEVAESLHDLGFVRAAKGNLEEGEDLIREALRMKRGPTQGDDVDISITLQDLGQILRRQGKLSQAEAAQREALAIRRRLLGDHVDTFLVLEHLAKVLAEEDQLPEAESLLREAQAMRMRLYGDTHCELVGSLLKLWDVLDKQGRLTEPVASQALVIARKLATNNPTLLDLNLAEAGRVLREQKKYADSETLLREAVVLALRSPDPSLVLLPPLNELSILLQEQGNTAEMEKFARETLANARAQTFPSRRCCLVLAAEY